ncbi:DivIVA domain-containing protein [Paenibacillaceae bacterium]|nr:DivIVA domain-containing protein [Paenibacillaceae bacterium]
MDSAKLAALKPNEAGVAFTTSDLLNMNFDRRLRGYDEDQVDKFREAVLKDYMTFHRIIESLQNQIAELRMNPPLTDNQLPSDSPLSEDNKMNEMLQRIRELEIYSWGKSKD